MKSRCPMKTIAKTTNKKCRYGELWNLWLLLLHSIYFYCLLFGLFWKLVVTFFSKIN